VIKRIKVDVQLNQPIVMLLDRGPEGKQVTNLGRVEFQYCVNEDRGIIWLPPEGRAAILRSGAQRGDQIQLMQTSKGWSAQRLGDSPAPPEPPTRMVAPRPAYSNGNGHHEPPPPAAPPKPPVPMPQLAAEPHPIEALMFRCFVAGGRTLWRAYQKLLAEGCDYDKPQIEDVRAAGITLYIERTKNGGVK
jgi:hypothetical protein